MAALLFGGAGTFDWWQAWLYLAVYFGASLAITSEDARGTTVTCTVPLAGVLA